MALHGQESISWDMERQPRLTKWSHIWAVALVIVGIVSFFILAPVASDPTTLSGVRASLDSQQSTVTGLAGTATAIAAGLSVVPGDALTPVADKLIEVSGWFVVIVVTIFVQKILVTVAGSIAFALIVPIACMLGIVSIYSRRVGFRTLAIKLAAFAIVLAFAVPASIWASTALTETHAQAALAANAAEDLAEEEDSLPGEDGGGEAPASSDTDFLGSIQSWIAGAVDNVGNFVQSATNSIDEAKDDAVRASEYYTEQFALLLVTTCIMPILVLVLLWWVIKMLFSIDLTAKGSRRSMQSRLGIERLASSRREPTMTARPAEEEKETAQQPDSGASGRI